jgi:hypothetical protein
MSLPAGEQRALKAIEGVLEASEPRITAMFAMFTKLAPRGEPIGAERLARRRPMLCTADALYVVIPVLATLALIATLVIGLGTSRVAACRTGVAAARSSIVSCSGRVLRPAAP